MVTIKPVAKRSILVITVICLWAISRGDLVYGAASQWNHSPVAGGTSHIPGFAVIAFWSDSNEHLEWSFVCVEYDLETAGRAQLRLSPAFGGYYLGTIERCGHEVVCSVSSDRENLIRLDLDTVSATAISLPRLPGRASSGKRLRDHVIVLCDPDSDVPASCYCWIKWADCSGGPLVDWLCLSGSWFGVPNQHGNDPPDQMLLYRMSHEEKAFSIARLQRKGGNLFFEHVMESRRRPIIAHPEGDWFISASWKEKPVGVYLCKPGMHEERILQVSTVDQYPPDMLYLEKEGLVAIACIQDVGTNLYLYNLETGDLSGPIRSDRVFTLIGWNQPTGEMILYAEPDLVRYSVEKGEWTHMASLGAPETIQTLLD